MTLTLRTLTLWTITFAVAGFGTASVKCYRPGNATDRALAAAALKRALASLDDEALDTASRLAAYRSGLRETDELLRRALRSKPTDTSAIERLATVRWESGVLEGGPDTDTVSSLMEIAAARAPRVPEIQADLGDLLCRMGRTEEAGPFLKRAVELSPSMTNRVVATMADSGLEPETVSNTLPRIPQVLVALKDSFLSAGRGATFLDLVERDLPNATPIVLATYGEACLQLRVPGRLKARLAELEIVDDPAIIAERARQEGHAAFALGDETLALKLADSARRSMPADPSYDEFFGDVALTSGRPADAASAFRSALSGNVRVEGSTRVRARLYRKIGQALEADGRGDLALDAYRRAISLDANEAHALARLADLEATVTGASPR